MNERILEWLERPELSFAVGALGAIAEFHQLAHDPPAQRSGMSLCTRRGALRITPREHAVVEPDRGPLPGGDPLPGHGGAQDGSFVTHRISLAADLASMGARHSITILDTDEHAVRDEHRGQRLFDMGLGLPHIDACVRSADPVLIAVLSECEGASILDPACPAMSAIKSASPHRVFVSAMARIEVYQPIPSRARGERTPPGPHTHVLPGLLARNALDAARHVVLEVFEPSA